MSLAFIILAFCLLSVHAQTSKLFQWQFSDKFLSFSLPSCQSFGITVKNFDPNNDTSALYGPPFYMIAFEVGGTPRTTLLGENATSLTWFVDHPVGTNLLLSVVDANGSAGGIPSSLYTVVAGQTTQCIKTTSASDFTVTANVSDTITTCQPWGLRIKGGVPPYNLTLAALNSPIVTNLTLFGQDDAFTYIDRADPNTQLIAGISDLTGRWATGTPIVKTQGSTNVDCVGLVSSSGSSAQLAQQEQAAAAARRKHRNSIIAGVVVSLGLLFLGGGAGFAWWYMRRRKAKIQQLSPEKQLDMSIKPFEEPAPSSGEGHVLSINSWINSTPLSSPKSAGLSATHSLQYTTSVSSSDANRDSSTTDSVSASSKPGFASFPVNKVRHAKSLEAAGLQYGHTPNTSIASSTSPLINRTTSASGSPLRPRQESSSSPGVEEEHGAVREYVIQHRDGGEAVVRELPPPYADRLGESSR